MVHIELTSDRTIFQPKFLESQRFFSDFLVFRLFARVVYCYLKWQLTKGSPIFQPGPPSLLYVSVPLLTMNLYRNDWGKLCQA